MESLLSAKKTIVRMRTKVLVQWMNSSNFALKIPRQIFTYLPTYIILVFDTKSGLWAAGEKGEKGKVKGASGCCRRCCCCCCCCLRCRFFLPPPTRSAHISVRGRAAQKEYSFGGFSRGRDVDDGRAHSFHLKWVEGGEGEMDRCHVPPPFLSYTQSTWIRHESSLPTQFLFWGLQIISLCTQRAPRLGGRISQNYHRTARVEYLCIYVFFSIRTRASSPSVWPARCSSARLPSARDLLPPPPSWRRCTGRPCTGVSARGPSGSLASPCWRSRGASPPGLGRGRTRGASG